MIALAVGAFLSCERTEELPLNIEKKLEGEWGLFIYTTPEDSLNVFDTTLVNPTTITFNATESIAKINVSPEDMQSDFSSISDQELYFKALGEDRIVIGSLSDVYSFEGGFSEEFFELRITEEVDGTNTATHRIRVYRPL